jgi:hypothetical protein
LKKPNFRAFFVWQNAAAAEEDVKTALLYRRREVTARLCKP